MITYLIDFGLVLPIHGTLCGLSNLLVPVANIYLYIPWQGIPWISSGKTQWLWLLRNFFGTIDAFFEWIPLILGGQSSGVPLLWGLL